MLPLLFLLPPPTTTTFALVACWKGTGIRSPWALTCSTAYRWCGNCRPGHLRHNAVHPQPHMHVVCWTGCQHGLPSPRCWQPRHAPFTAQFQNHDPPALWRSQGEYAFCRAVWWELERERRSFLFVGGRWSHLIASGVLYSSFTV